jgi:hypothetical protein
LEKLDAPIALLATGTLRTDSSHDALPKLCADDNGIELREASSEVHPHCTGEGKRQTQPGVDETLPNVTSR